MLLYFTKSKFLIFFFLLISLNRILTDIKIKYVYISKQYIRHSSVSHCINIMKILFLLIILLLIIVIITGRFTRSSEGHPRTKHAVNR